MKRRSTTHKGIGPIGKPRPHWIRALIRWPTNDDLSNPFSPTGTIRIKLSAPTAEIFKNLPTRCWTGKNIVIESRPVGILNFAAVSPHEASHNTMVDSDEQPPSCYRRRPPGPSQRLRAASSRLRDGFFRQTCVSLRPCVLNCSADRRFEPLTVSPLCLSLAGSISLSPARAYRVWLAATVRAGQLLPLQFVRRFTRR